MKKVADYTNFMEHPSDCVLRLLLEWQPSAAELTEKAYEQELQAWLGGKLPDVPIVAQYGIAKGKIGATRIESELVRAPPDKVSMTTGSLRFSSEPMIL